MIKWIARLRQPKREKLTRKPYTIIRRDRAEQWTVEERRWLHIMMSDPIWQKLLRWADDAICMDILCGSKEGRDPEWLEAMVAGRFRERDFYASMGSVAPTAEPPDPERLDPGVDGGPVTEDKVRDVNDERVTYQDDEGDTE